MNNTFGSFHREIDTQHCWRPYPVQTDCLAYDTTPNRLRFFCASYYSLRENYDYQRDDYFRQGIMSSSRINTYLEIANGPMNPMEITTTPIPEESLNNTNMSDTWDDVYLNTEESSSSSSMDDSVYVDEEKKDDDAEDDDMDYEPPPSGAVVLPPPMPITTFLIDSRKPLVAPGGHTPVIDIFLMAVILDHGIRLVNANCTDAFEIYDYKRYYDFSRSLPNQQQRHLNVTPASRMKALKLWLTGSGDRATMMNVFNRLSPTPYRMNTREPQKKKMAWRYQTMLSYLKEFIEEK